MLYCERCMRLSKALCCAHCGKKKLRTPRSSDPVFLAGMDYFAANLLEAALEKHGIPVIKQPVLGAGIRLRVGEYMEIYRVFVPFCELETAEVVFDELFSGDVALVDEALEVEDPDGDA